MKQHKTSEKTMLKMTREGAVEVNAATGKKKRISKRIRDADFAKTEAPQPPEQAAQPLPGGTAPAPTADAPTLPHAPGAEREQDTAAAESTCANFAQVADNGKTYQYGINLMAQRS